MADVSLALGLDIEQERRVEVRIIRFRIESRFERLTSARHLVVVDRPELSAIPMPHYRDVVT